MATENLLNYVNYDFDELVEQLQDRLRLRDAWKDTYISSTGEMLIEFYAYVANLVLFYIERRAEESYLDTAKNLSSVINLVKLINYSPKRVSSATGTLRFSISEAHTKRIDIEKYTICKTASGVEYFVGEKSSDGGIEGGGSILVGGTSVDLKAIQGEFVTKEITSNGAGSQVYFINDTNVENDIFMVEIDETQDPDVDDYVRWEKVTSFVSSEPESKHYKLIQSFDNKLSLMFGDGVNGRAPALGAVIKVQYVRSAGSGGNVVLADKITTLITPIYDEDGTEVDVSVTNPQEYVSGEWVISKFQGGDAAEDIDEIKDEAPRVFATGDRAVIRNDFIAILENIAGIKNANAWGENEESPPNYDMFNRVRLCILMDEWQYPSTSKEEEISAALYDKSMMTVKYEFIDAVILDIIPVMDVIVEKGRSITETQSTINTTMAAQFVLGSTTKLGESKQYSNLVQIIDALDSVAYIHMVLEIRQELDEIGSSGDYDDTLLATAVLPESVRVFVDDAYIGTDVDMEDGHGEFGGTESGYEFTGSITYSTGVITLDFSTPPDGTVYVRYQQDEDRDVVVTNRQICRLYNDVADVTSIATES